MSSRQLLAAGFTPFESKCKVIYSPVSSPPLLSLCLSFCSKEERKRSILGAGVICRVGGVGLSDSVGRPPVSSLASDAGTGLPPTVLSARSTALEHADQEGAAQEKRKRPESVRLRNEEVDKEF